jgi:hypothetical protein
MRKIGDLAFSIYTLEAKGFTGRGIGSSFWRTILEELASTSREGNRDAAGEVFSLKQDTCKNRFE